MVVSSVAMWEECAVGECVERVSAWEDWSVVRVLVKPVNYINTRSKVRNS